MSTNNPPYQSATRELAINVQKRLLLRKNLRTVDESYQVYSAEHLQQQLPGKPMARATFYRLWAQVPEEQKILKRRGKRAAREYTRAKLGKMHRQGFMANAECDAYHEPIKLLSSFDFAPLQKRPVHHMVVESETTAIMGLASNYQTGSERVEYSIDSVKSAFLPKTKVQETWGTTHPWPVYGKTLELTQDAGAAYNNADFDGFLGLCYTSAKVTRSRKPYEKPLVEAANKIIKTQFTRPLLGSYDDTAPKEEQEKIVPVYTELEHAVLLHRYIIDEYNQSINKGAKIRRTAHWLREAQRQPPVLPPNPQTIVNYLGVEDRKTIMEKVGIQVTVLGTAYVYNSNRLQALGRKIRKDISDKAKRRVFLKWSLSQPDFILVRDPYTSEVFKVERLVDDPDTEFAERRLKYHLPPQFYETQNLAVLARMSNQDIHTHARMRRAAIDQYRQDRRRNNAPQATALEAAALRDRQHFASPPQEQQQDTAQETNTGFSGFSPGHAEDIDWGGAL